MSLVCEIALDRKRLPEEIRATYSQVAERPDGDFHCHRGPDYASSALGYDRSELAELLAS